MVSRAAVLTHNAPKNILVLKQKQNLKKESKKLSRVKQKQNLKKESKKLSRGTLPTGSTSIKSNKST